MVTSEVKNRKNEKQIIGYGGKLTERLEDREAALYSGVLSVLLSRPDLEMTCGYIK